MATNALSTPRRRTITVGLLFAGVTVGACALASTSSAATSQNGADMVVINPGGSRQLNGSDGLAIVLNAAQAYKPGTSTGQTSTGSDNLFFANTAQWCCSGTSPLLNIGGVLRGEAGAARSAPESASFTTTQVIATSGSAQRAPSGTTAPADPTATGSGTAHLRYTALEGGLMYTIDRHVSYTYPNATYEDRFVFTIPTGSTAAVKFYMGGDATPGDRDTGTTGLMTTTPTRAIYEVNPTSGIFVSFTEGPGASSFTGWFSGAYNSVYSAIKAGSNLPNTVNANPHDAGLDIQWTLPSTPGTYERTLTGGSNFQQVQVSAAFAASSVQLPGDALLNIQILNSTTSAASGLGFALPLPSGLTVTGTPTNSCGGTVSAPAGATSVSGSGMGLGSAANCIVAVPVSGVAGSYSIGNPSFTVSGGLVKGFGTSEVTLLPDPTPPPPTPDPVPTPAPTPAIPAATQAEVTTPPSLSVRLLPSRRMLRAGQDMTLGVRTVSTAPKSTAEARMRGQMDVATAGEVSTCVRLPANLVIASLPSGSLRSGRLVCWRLGDIPAGEQRTKVMAVRASAVRSVARTIAATARSAGGTQATAEASGTATVRIRPRAPRVVVTG